MSHANAQVGEFKALQEIGENVFGGSSDDLTDGNRMNITQLRHFGKHVSNDADVSNVDAAIVQVVGQG